MKAIEIEDPGTNAYSCWQVSDADFHHQTDSLVEHSTLTKKYETEVIYAPPTAEDELTLGEGTTPVGRQVIDGFNAGASIVNYVGHGGGGRWASSRMMDLEDPHINLTNIAQLPFVISMTCFTGAFDIPGGCLAEEFLRSENWRSNRSHRRHKHRVTTTRPYT